MSEWFSSWFDSPYYHKLYKHRDFREAELFISNLLEYLNLPHGARVADIPCGKGRHSIFLHQQGFDVTGVDLAPESISEANRSAHSGLRFSVGDMRDLSFSEEFDAVFNLFTSFGYFDQEEENVLALKNLVSGIKPGGKFVMDFMNIGKVLRVLVPEEELILDGVRYSIRRFVEKGVLVKTIDVEEGKQTLHFQERVKVIGYEDFETYLNSFGFKIVSVFGSYRLEAFDALNSDRLVFIAERTA